MMKNVLRSVLAGLTLVALLSGGASSIPISVELNLTATNCAASFLPNATIYIEQFREDGTFFKEYEGTTNAFGRFDIYIDQPLCCDYLHVTITPNGGAESGIHKLIYWCESCSDGGVQTEEEEEYVVSFPVFPCDNEDCYSTKQNGRIILKYGACHEF